MGKLNSILKGIAKNSLPYAAAIRLFPPSMVTEGTPPVLFNENGERVLVAYLQDKHNRHSPYTLVSGRIPKRILWDRFNNALHTKFYSHKEILKRSISKDDCSCFGYLLESENISYDDYNLIFKHSDAVKKMDALFTHSERLLDKYENACIIPGGGVWYGTVLHGGKLQNNRYEMKSKLLSIVSSQKKMCPLHIFRIDLAKEMIRSNVGDVYGTIVNKRIKIADSLSDYMYSVGIENAQTKYYYTEKLMNCFASMTVPVYYGATGIGNFFNTDGIIQIKRPTVKCAIETIRKFCSREDYESRRDAIIDNYYRVQKYLCIEDFLMDHYYSKFIF